MKFKWVNIISVLVIAISLTSLKFFVPKILNHTAADNKGEVVRVEGDHKEAAQEEKKEKQSTGNNFEALLRDVPDAPEKKKTAGEMYARARSAIVIDAETGTILHYQDGKRKTAIASLTKMMTAVLVAENIKDLKNEIVTIDKETVFSEGTVVGCPRTGYCISTRLQVGEKISAYSLLQAMLMNSTNDAAMALGKHIAGSKDEFANMMNQKAREIGLSDTNFCNPSGLDEDDRPGQCYSTAYDLARIAAYSLKYEVIWNIMRMEDLDIYSTDGKISHHIINTDVLLDQMSNCLGGKTGFTYEAGKSLMMAAHHPTNKNHRVIAVLLDDEYRWEDMKSLMSWVFVAYDWPEKKL